MGRKPKSEVPPNIPREELQAYVAKSYKIFTVTEMAEESGHPGATIKLMCDKMGVLPITQGERVHKFILNNMHLSLNDQADALEMTYEALKAYYKKFGIDVKKAGKGVRVSEFEKKKREAFLKSHTKLGPIAQSYYDSGANSALTIINTARVAIMGQ